MWEAVIKQLSTSTYAYHLLRDNQPVSFRMWLQLLQSTPEFANFYTKLLTKCSFEGFFWEVKPIARQDLDKTFSFVLVESKELAGLQANPAEFGSHFATTALVVHFPNLGGDAQLVVPTPQGHYTPYAHLANFLRQADEGQIQAFWRQVARVYVASLSHTPRWLSTSGLGVSWLHVRIDTRPKYYQHTPYRKYS